MTDRVRHPRDVRIVPGAAPASSSAPTPRASSNATAVQIFRLLTSQAEAGPTAAPVDDFGEQPAGQTDTPARDMTGSGSGTAIPAPPPAGEQPQPQPPTAALSHGEAQRDGSTRSAIAGAHALARRQTPTPEPHEQDAALGKQIVQACAAAAHGELFTRELADRIARFCSTSGTSGDASWAVTLPMNPAVLPDTLLHLQLSPSSIGIRFETSHPRSTQLISDNTDALRTRLANALGRRIDVDVAA